MWIYLLLPTSDQQYSDMTRFQSFWRDSYCNNSYWGHAASNNQEACVQRGLMFFRFTFWIVGLIGERESPWPRSRVMLCL